MSNLLIDDRPIMFLPKLAIALESCERAIILQQIHWLLLLPKGGIVIDGHKWVWGSYEEWCKDYFPMWKPQNLAKHIRKLEALGVLISAELNAKAHDHTKHYRINYEHERLQPILHQSIVSEQYGDIESDEYQSKPSVPHRSKASIYRTETTTKNTAETTAKNVGRSTRPPSFNSKGSAADRSGRKTGYNPADYPDL